MTQETQAYSPGDWIVHRHHGVGQIKGNKVMHIGEQENTYCQIKTRDSTIWVPTEKLGSDWLRPLASQDEIEEALEVLQSPPHEMDADPVKRKIRISKIQPANSPSDIAEILRDLWVHKKSRKSIPPLEVEALHYFTDLFLSEWSSCMKMEIGVARKKLFAMLAQA